MIRCSYRYDVDIVIFEHPAIVTICLYFVTLFASFTDLGCWEMENRTVLNRRR